MTPGVSRGILQAIAAGRLTATSVMTTSPWWPEAAADLKLYVDRVDVGLHLNLTLGAPLGPMLRFAPDERLPAVGTLLKLHRRRALPLDEIAAEIERQADAFVAQFGRPPDHVDGHQHVHGLRDIRRLVIAALRRRGWCPWLRDSGDTAGRILRRRASAFKALGIALLSRGLDRDAADAGLVTNDGFAGFSAFSEGADYAEAFTRYLVAPGRRHLVMCHPGHVDDALRTLDPVVATREQELSFLLSPRFTDILARHGAALCRLSHTA